MKEKFCRGEARVEAVLHKPAGHRLPALLHFEVGQGAALKAIWDALAVDNLLPNTRNHLRHVEVGALGAALGHDLGRVAVGQRLAAQQARLLANAAEVLLDLRLHRLLCGAPRLALDAAGLELLNVQANIEVY